MELGINYKFIFRRKLQQNNFRGLNLGNIFENIIDSCLNNFFVKSDMVQQWSADWVLLSLSCNWKEICLGFLSLIYNEIKTFVRLHFIAFFHLISLTVVHKGRQQKSRKRQWKRSSVGQQNIFFIFLSEFNLEISPKNATKHRVA